MKIRRVLLAIGVLSTLGLSSCGSSDTSSSPDTSVAQMTLVPAGNVIDVRTATEFAEGHVQGARNLDIQNGDFEKALETLDKSAAYNVYCRSGNRSAAAVEMMRNAGFTNVVDLGASKEAAKALSLPIVTD
jgi:rhodanese-related sulfurtransferase